MSGKPLFPTGEVHMRVLYTQRPGLFFILCVIDSWLVNFLSLSENIWDSYKKGRFIVLHCFRSLIVLPPSRVAFGLTPWCIIAEYMEKESHLKYASQESLRFRKSWRLPIFPPRPWFTDLSSVICISLKSHHFPVTPWAWDQVLNIWTFHNHFNPKV